MLTVLSSWCPSPATSDTSIQKARKYYSKRIWLISICTLFCIIQAVREETRSPNLKYILMWTPHATSPLSYWKTGRKTFIESKCQFSNCYLTSRREFFGGNLSNFHAVLFNGRNLYNITASDLPKIRSGHQKYIFLNLESSDNQPICNPLLDGFFNWTATYKLNSDIYLPYKLIMNRTGDEVGPRFDMTWVHFSKFNKTLVPSLGTKNKAAAWFVSHCHTRSKREKYASKLFKELMKYNLTLDVYGKCGKNVCSRDDQDFCDDLVRKNYFFHLSFENSFAEDYVTEKVYNALMNDVVPIVYGGANYARYLPPGSYIDARKYTPKNLAYTMAQLINTPVAYQEFFRWKNHYTFHTPAHVCRLCAALNDQTMVETYTVYEEFRRWWNPDHIYRCKTKAWGS